MASSKKVIKGIKYNVINPKEESQHVGGSLANSSIEDSKKGVSPVLGPYVDIEILQKREAHNLSVSSMEPVRLRLGKSEFGFIQYENNQLLEPNLKWPYTIVQKLVIREKPMHMYIYFTGTGDQKEQRVNVVSSYLQLVTNELLLRCTHHKKVVIPVEFEKRATTFDYGDPILSLAPATQNTTRQQLSGGDSGFQRRTDYGKTSDLLSPNVAPEVKRELDQTDKDLDDLLDVVGDIEHIAINMGESIKHQTDQINRMNDKVDNLSVRTKENSQKIDHLLH